MTDEERAVLKKKMEERTGVLKETNVNQQMSKKQPGKRNAIIVLVVSLVALCGLFVLAAVMKSKEFNASTNHIENIKVVKEKTVDVEPVAFHIVSQDEYVRDGRKCGLYRVYADKTDMTDDEMIVSFNTFIREQKDNYYLHDVMIYSSAEKADGSEAFDIADIEQTTDSKSPVITKK